MNGKIHDKNTDFLFQAILALETPEECYRFFDDLCTVPELKAMSQRLAVAHDIRLCSILQLFHCRPAKIGGIYINMENCPWHAPSPFCQY